MRAPTRACARRVSRRDRSILDSVTARVKELQQSLGPTDNRKVSDYLESLRDVERRIQKAEEQSTKEIPDVSRPAGVPDGFQPHVELLYDLQLFQSLTYGMETNPRTIGFCYTQFEDLFRIIQVFFHEPLAVIRKYYT